MTWLSDAIVIDTAELRAAAAALREAERGTVELVLRLPREAWAAPDWLASSAADGLGLARRELDELGAELHAESKRLDVRAEEVDSADQRWWEIVNGASRCGCVLPSGTVVAQPGQFTAASSASGLGIGDTGTSLDVGAISAAAGAGLGVSVIGGASDSLFGGFTPGSGYGVSVIGGGDSLFPSASEQAAERASVAAFSAALYASPGGGGGGTGIHIGGAYLPASLLFPESGPTLLPGDSRATYTTASGRTFVDYSWNRPDDTPALVL